VNQIIDLSSLHHHRANVIIATLLTLCARTERVFNRINPDYLIIVFLALVALASAADLIADLQQGVNNSHLLQEGVILGIALAAIAWILATLRRQSRELSDLHAEVDAIRESVQSQPEEVTEAKGRLAEVVSKQFQVWSLTKSEYEIGFMLLKGFSLKEISQLRGTAEKTIRQQASAIYKKAGLTGRHAFSAWFIEDIL
jgi:DNA-binding CsgD family transcriptional regulator